MRRIQDGEDAERDRHRIGPQHIGCRKGHHLRVRIDQMRREQPAAGTRHFGSDDRQQPYRVMPSRLCSWRVNIRYG